MKELMVIDSKGFRRIPDWNPHVMITGEKEYVLVVDSKQVAQMVNRNAKALNVC